MTEKRMPFIEGEKLEHSGRFSEVYDIATNPNFVVKIVNASISEQFTDDLKYIKKTFADDLPEFHLVYGQNNRPSYKENRDGKPYIFMKKIKEATKLEPYQQHLIASQLDDLLTKIGEEFLKNFKTFITTEWDHVEIPRAKMLDLYKPSNLMFGSISAEQQQRLYFIDVYPMLSASVGDAYQYITNIYKSVVENGKLKIHNTYSLQDIDYEHSLPKTKEILDSLKNYLNI